VLWFARKPMLRTAYNRSLGAVVLLASPLWLYAAIMAWMLDIPPTQGQMVLRFGWVVMLGLVTLTMESRLWPSWIAFMVGGWLSAYGPEYFGWGSLLSNGTLAVNML